MTLLRRTSAGATWLISARLLTRAIDFVTLLILARLLAPAEFGLVALSATFITIAEAVLELPVGAVLMRERDIEPGHLHTAFTLNALRGCALALIAAACAFPLSQVYHDSRVVPIMLALVIAPVMRGLQSPGMVFYMRDLQFGRSFLIETFGKFGGIAAAIPVAAVTHSYWALVLNTVTTPCVMVLLSYVLAPFWPRFSLEHWRRFSGFLAWTTASQALVAISWQCDRVILGLFVPHAALGRYSLASDLAAVPEQAFVKPLGAPLLSAFSLLREDRSRLARAYLQSSSAICTLGMPIMVGVSLLSEPAVRLLLGGGKWLEAAPLLSWISLTSAIALLTAPLTALAMALGRTRVFVQRSLAEIAIQLPLVAVSAVYAGVAGVIAAKLIVSIYVTLVSMFLVRDLVGLSLIAQLRELWRVALSTLAMALMVLGAHCFIVRSAGWTSEILGFVVTVALGAGVYIATIVLTWHWSGRPLGLETSFISRIWDWKSEQITR